MEQGEGRGGRATHHLVVGERVLDGVHVARADEDAVGHDVAAALKPGLLDAVADQVAHLGCVAEYQARVSCLRLRQEERTTSERERAEAGRTQVVPVVLAHVGEAALEVGKLALDRRALLKELVGDVALAGLALGAPPLVDGGVDGLVDAVGLLVVGLVHRACERAGT